LLGRRFYSFNIHYHADFNILLLLMILSRHQSGCKFV
jgi:hypothetical protein